MAKPNVRVHLRGGQTIETRMETVKTRADQNADLTFLQRTTKPGWPQLHCVRLDAVDAIEWLGTS
jgi:hypothetical protein